jgi:endo-1,4-beta-xylanase
MMESYGLECIAATNGLLYGSSVRPASLGSTGKPIPAYSFIVSRECSLLTCADMHWSQISPTQGAFNTASGDYVVRYAQDNGQKIHGHTLVWHGTVPTWFAGLSSGAALDALRNHVTSVVGHFAGQMHSWDVVNEAIKPDDKQPGGFRNNIFLQKLGAQYIEVAFRAARAADPAAMLIYNDFSFELNIPDDINRQNALLAMIDDFQARGVPIDAIGIQSHMYFADMSTTFDPNKLLSFLNQIAKRGLKILVTEFDMVDVGTVADIASRDTQIAYAYRRYLSAVLSCPAVIAIINWGLFDNDSWIVRGESPSFVRPDGLPPRPLPFDAAYNPKLAYSILQQSLGSALPR